MRPERTPPQPKHNEADSGLTTTVLSPTHSQPDANSTSLGDNNFATSTSILIANTEEWLAQQRAATEENAAVTLDPDMASTFIPPFSVFFNEHHQQSPLLTSQTANSLYQSDFSGIDQTIQQQLSTTTTSGRHSTTSNRSISINVGCSDCNSQPSQPPVPISGPSRTTVIVSYTNKPFSPSVDTTNSALGPNDHYTVTRTGTSWKFKHRTTER